MGTMLQAAGLAAGARPEEMVFTAPEKLTEIHRAYIQAGADIVYANTFGANAKKLAGSDLTVSAVIQAAVSCAKKACEGTGARVALDIGPLGELLEPTGTLAFEDAYSLFAEMTAAGEKAGADLIAIETMTDLYEARAALLAAKEHSTLPVIVSMSFEENGRTFAGVSVEAMAASLGPLGADALGINCSLGPRAILPLAKRLCKAANTAVFVKPNAGLPDPLTGQYNLTAEAFCGECEGYLNLGVSAIGGCCGTDPDFIKALARLVQDHSPAPSAYVPQSLLSSATRVVTIDGIRPVGERINPTGKKRLQQALASGDLSHLQSLAAEQESSGAAILDVNVGAPGVDEVQLLPKAVKAVQAVCDLPLVLDSSNADALAAALRVYNGKPLVNSTSGEREKMESILPLCKRYGAAVIGLTLDESGIPATAEERFAIAENILLQALRFGLERQDVYIDCLTLAASAGGATPEETLRATLLVKETLGLKTLLGVSNVSFGLPNRPLVNRTFLNLALWAGLDLPILNPGASDMMDTIAAFELLMGLDPDSQRYIGRFRETESPAATPKNKGATPLRALIESGLRTEAASETRRLLEEGAEGLALVNGEMMPALDTVGQGFEAGTLFLPQLLASAEAAKAAFEVIRNQYGQSDLDGPPVIVATVQGDIHDIGKNIAKVLLENYGFRVIDLGRDVPPQTIVAAAKEHGAKLVGLSALMTTTLPAMEKTIAALREEGLSCKVMVGGAVLTESFAMKIGADYYVKDARKSVEAALEIHKKEI
ncbi:homocysteine S-methyltransferase family protein [Ruminococcaceae bacterium OttesenSCG-928-I18]|nr:homocysteine S-methyltransferase family protein [Ruminococcaceae bacterium OttesenSCG-928-I18]